MPRNKRLCMQMCTHVFTMQGMSFFKSRQTKVSAHFIYFFCLYTIQTLLNLPLPFLQTKFDIFGIFLQPVLVLTCCSRPPKKFFYKKRTPKDTGWVASFLTKELNFFFQKSLSNLKMFFLKQNWVLIFWNLFQTISLCAAQSEIRGSV